MGEALPQGGVCAHWHATLLDRYLVLSNRPSVYGTFFGAYYEEGHFKLVDYEVVDPENLEKRRAQVGYESLEMDRQKLTARAAEEGWKQTTYEECLKDFENTSIKGGYRLQ